MTARSIGALLVAASLTLASCGGSSGSDGGAKGAALDPALLQSVLTDLADDVIIPNYVALDDAATELSSSVGELCTSPSDAALASARDAWEETLAAYQRSRAGAVGPAMERRLMSDVAFEARPNSIDALLAGDDPVDVESLATQGAPVRGLYALEVGLFGDGSDALASADGARRCSYVASASDLVGDAVATVASDWTEGDARQGFLDGLAGSPSSTVAVLLNELSRRTNEADTQGLRDMTEADRADDLDDLRADGPAGFRLADRRAMLEGVVALIGDGSDGISVLVAAQSADTADRLVAAGGAVDDAMAALPDSVTEAFDGPEVIQAASDAVADLKVLLSTEVASQLGVTIMFSDADGDS